MTSNADSGLGGVPSSGRAGEDRPNAQPVGQTAKPLAHNADTGGRYRSCLYWDGHSYQLACPDDLCHGSDQTLCGLEHGFDFDVQDDEWDEDWPPIEGQG